MLDTLVSLPRPFLPATLAVILGVPCLLAHAQASTAPHAAVGDAALDYSRQLEGREAVFIPRKGLQDGPLFYRDYEKTVLASVAFGSLRQVLVTYSVNEATRLAAENEIKAKGFSPTRVAPKAKQGTFCEVSQGVLDLIGERARQFPPKVMAQNSGTQLCSVALFFDPVDEAKVVGYLKSHDAVNETGSLTSCSPRSLSYDASRLMARLEANGTLVGETASGSAAAHPDVLTGDFWGFVYDTSVASAQEPALLAATDARAAALDFLARAPVENQRVQLLRSNAGLPRVACDRADISIRLH